MFPHRGRSSDRQYPPEFLLLCQTMALHGFEQAARMMQPYDVPNWHQTQTCWQNYPQCMAHYPIKLRNTPHGWR